MKKLVLKVNVHCERDKQRAMKTVSCIHGIDSIAFEKKDNKLTLIGDMDPVIVVERLRKQWVVEILTVGPAKEEKKEDDKKKAEEAEKKKKAEEAEKKKKAEEAHIAEMVKLYKAQAAYCHNINPQMHMPPVPVAYYHQFHSIDEYPNACTIS